MSAETQVVSGTRQKGSGAPADRTDARGLTRAEFLRASVGVMLLATGTSPVEQALSDLAMRAGAMLTRPTPSTGETMPVIGLVILIGKRGQEALAVLAAATF
jgi:hypothetical protein